MIESKEETRTKKSIIDQNMLNRSTTAGVAEVFRIRSLSSKKDEIRKSYGTKVLKSVIFGFEHKQKEDFLTEIEVVEKKFQYKDVNYSSLVS